MFAVATSVYWQERNMRQVSIVLLSLGVLLTSSLLFMQITQQHSIGGLWYLLGERKFSGSTPGIANASLMGTLVLRPYASFPHPNVAAGYLLFSVVLLLFLQEDSQGRWQQLLLKLSIIAGSIGLILTLSRSAILTFLFCLIIIFVFPLRTKRLNRKWVLSFFSLFLILSLLLLPRFLTLSLTDEAVTLRLQLLKESVEVFHTSPLLGVGVKNFLIALSGLPHPALPYSSLQPVHNMYVLLLVEIGLMGLVWILPLLGKLVLQITNVSGQQKTLKFTLSLSLLLLGTVDHYLYTLHQGQLLLALVLGVISQGKWPDEPHFPFQKKQISRKRSRNHTEL